MGVSCSPVDHVRGAETTVYRKAGCGRTAVPGSRSVLGIQRSPNAALVRVVELIVLRNFCGADLSPGGAISEFVADQLTALRTPCHDACTVPESGQRQNTSQAVMNQPDSRKRERQRASLPEQKFRDTASELPCMATFCWGSRPDCMRLKKRKQERGAPTSFCGCTPQVGRPPFMATRVAAPAAAHWRCPGARGSRHSTLWSLRWSG